MNPAAFPAAGRIASDSSLVKSLASDRTSGIGFGIEASRASTIDKMAEIIDEEINKTTEPSKEVAA